MEKRKWVWSRKSSPGEEDHSNCSVSSQSNDQEGTTESPNGSSVSVDVASTPVDEGVNETVKTLTDKLSAALVNVAAKECLVQQHARVAEEAVAGWERAENEVVEFKQHLEAAVQHNLSLEVRVSHLEHALRECVRQLRQAKRYDEWEAKNAAPVVDPDIQLTLEALQMENSCLRRELMSGRKELELMTVERDLSTKAAETASKSQLESIKRVLKLEAECRKLQALARKLDSYNNQKPVASACVTDGSCKARTTEANELELSLSESWTSTLVASSVEIDMMDDFQEMERLAGLQESERMSTVSAHESMTRQMMELQEKIGKMEVEKLDLQNAQNRLTEAEIVLEELQKALAAVNKTNGLLEFQVISMEAEAREMRSKIDSLKGEIEEERNLSSELTASMEAEAREMCSRIYSLEGEIEEERSLSCELKASMEAEARDTSSQIESLKGEIEKERILSAEVTAKCEELVRIIQENEQSNSEVKVKPEDVAVAADKLAECQKTIASLGRQLKSLATLEDFLIDTSNIGLGGGGETWMLTSSTNEHDLDRAIPNRDRDSSSSSHMEFWENVVPW